MRISAQSAVATDTAMTFRLDVSGYVVFMYKPRKAQLAHPIFLVKKKDRSALAIRSTSSNVEGKHLRKAVQDSVQDQLIVSEMDIAWVEPQALSWAIATI